MVINKYIDKLKNKIFFIFFFLFIEISVNFYEKELLKKNGKRVIFLCK